MLAVIKKVDVNFKLTDFNSCSVYIRPIFGCLSDLTCKIKLDIFK